jgi:SAM-dependent methyltransferase
MPIVAGRSPTALDSDAQRGFRRRRFLERENRETLGLMRVEPHHRVVEVGCGPGWAIRQATASATAGHVVGLDVSETMLARAHRRNRRAIARGRVSLRLIDGANLDVEPGSFDRAFAIHCLYFWKSPSEVIAQLYEALRDDGELVLAFRPDSENIPPRFRDETYRFYSPADVEGMLARAGFGDVRIVRKPELGTATGFGGIEEDSHHPQPRCSESLRSHRLQLRWMRPPSRSIRRYTRRQP